VHAIVQRSANSMNRGVNPPRARFVCVPGVRFRTSLCANGQACVFPRVIVPLIRWRDLGRPRADAAEKRSFARPDPSHHKPLVGSKMEFFVFAPGDADDTDKTVSGVPRPERCRPTRFQATVIGANCRRNSKRRRYCRCHYSERLEDKGREVGCGPPDLLSDEPR
jgi:hypothetical protein